MNLQRPGILLLCAASACSAEVHALTLKQAVDRALAQNAEIVIARLEEQKAARQVDIAKDPFVPKVFAGSGLAYTYGFPMTVDGQAPTVFQVTGVAAFFDRPQRHRLAQTREEAEGAGLATEKSRDDVVFRTVESFLEAEQTAKTAEMVRSQVDGLTRVGELLRLRVEEGRELPVELKRAEVDIARARQRAETAEADQEYAEARLAYALGFAPGDRVRAVESERAVVDLPDSADRAAAAALEDNVELRRLESSLRAQGFAVKAAKSERLPKMNLVAKYGLFARFNNYEEFFQRFQRNNAQIGASFEVPLFLGAAYKARVSQVELEITRLRTEMESVRGRIHVEARRLFQEVQAAETAMGVAKAELDLAREELGVMLAQMDEGRVSLRDVEAARYIENERWISLYQARYSLEAARYRLLDSTGALLAAIR